VVQLVAGVRQFRPADHPAVGVGAGIGVDHRDGVGPLGRAVERRDVRELLDRGRRRVAG
jgi:hypothetical protein